MCFHRRHAAYYCFSALHHRRLPFVLCVMRVSVCNSYMRVARSFTCTHEHTQTNSAQYINISIYNGLHGIAFGCVVCAPMYSCRVKKTIVPTALVDGRNFDWNRISINVNGHCAATETCTRLC